MGMEAMEETATETGQGTMEMAMEMGTALVVSVTLVSLQLSQEHSMQQDTLKIWSI